MDVAIKERLEQAVKDGVFPGAVVGVVKANGERLVLPVGNLTYDRKSSPVVENTIYDIASITKAIPGSCSLLKLIDEGQIRLEDRLVDFVPDFGNYEDKREVRIKHILTYTIDIDMPPLSTLITKSAEELIDLVIKAPLKNPPGGRHLYTNATAGFIGLIVEKVTGQKLDHYADENFFVPLKMARTTYHPGKFDKNEVAPTEIDIWRGRVIQGEVHDESTAILQGAGYVTAIAGLFSTVPDLLNFLEMLLNEGMKDGRQYFSKAMVKQMHTNQIDLSINDKAGLGWAMNWPEATGTHCSEETFSKSGFTGTLVVVDPVKGVAYALLSNRTYPKRPKDNSAIMAVRKDVSNIIFTQI